MFTIIDRISALLGVSESHHERSQQQRRDRVRPRAPREDRVTISDEARRLAREAMTRQLDVVTNGNVD